MRGMSYLVEFMYQFMNTNTINIVWVPIWTFWRKHTNSAVILFLTLYGIQPMVSVFFTLNGVTCATGGRNMFSRHQWRKLPKVLGESPTPPHTLRKDPIFRYWRQYPNTWRQNSNVWRQDPFRQNLNISRQNANIWTKIQINEFLYH